MLSVLKDAEGNPLTVSHRNIPGKEFQIRICDLTSPPCYFIRDNFDDLFPYQIDNLRLDPPSPLTVPYYAAYFLHTDPLSIFFDRRQERNITVVNTDWELRTAIRTTGFKVVQNTDK